MELFKSRYHEAEHSVFKYDTLFLQGPGEEDEPVEGDWNDEEDEDFDDKTEFINDMHEIQVDDDLGEPDSEDDDHMPNGDLL
ncbi:MAG: hypothetical protein JWR05_2373 [Mucilaginibacter sp.]|jgi:hypothetical protein|nr:hypothetical protein [Mucilaginibacter sp.]